MKNKVPISKEDKKTRSILKKKRIVNTWSKDKIEGRIREIQSELKGSPSNQIKKTRKRLLKTRLAKLLKASKGEISVGGQLAKKPSRPRYRPDPATIKGKRSKKQCLCCRKKGHTMQECKENKTRILSTEDDSTATGKPSGGPLCFNCGLTSHTLKNCPTKQAENGFLPFASCFVCGEQGHLALTCQQNNKGIYPRGGGCHICHSQLHLMRDCNRRTQVHGQTESNKNKKNAQETKRKPSDSMRDDDNDSCWN